MFDTFLRFQSDRFGSMVNVTSEGLMTQEGLDTLIKMIELTKDCFPTVDEVEQRLILYFVILLKEQPPNDH
jgi:hypothetical protein